MENLVPKEFYSNDESGYRQRVGLVIGTLFGLGMGLACFFLTPSIIGLSWRFLLTICAGVCSGLCFGNTFPRGYQKRMSSIIDRLYAGDATIDNPPPPGKDLRYRLPCSWKRSQNFAVGGVLYIGPQGLFFVPHKMNLPRDLSILEMGPRKSLKFSLTPQKPTGFFKLFVPHPPLVLQVIWLDGSAQFVVPAPSQLLPLIEERVGSVGVS